jgi:hypothetical protein
MPVTDIGDDSGVVSRRDVMLEEVALVDGDARRGRARRYSLRSQRSHSRQFEERAVQVGIMRHDRDEKRAGAASDVDDAPVASEIIDGGERLSGSGSADSSLQRTLAGLQRCIPRDSLLRLPRLFALPIPNPTSADS